MVAAAITNPEQVAVGKFNGKCIITIGHLLPPDARFVASRRALSVYLTDYSR
jgi:hypothetical protein